MDNFIKEAADEFGITQKDAKAFMKFLFKKMREGASFQGYLITEVVDIPEKNKISYLKGEAYEYTIPAHKELKIKLAKKYKMID